MIEVQFRDHENTVKARKKSRKKSRTPKFRIKMLDLGEHVSSIRAMTMARATVLLEDETGIYHCVSRCVRRAFLCGWDAYSGRDYEHRKAWVKNRVRELSGLFSVEVCAYAVMSNHLHLVVKSDPPAVGEWSNEEVARRWFQLFPKGRDDKGQPLKSDRAIVRRFLENRSRVEVCRKRLGNLSWFMRCLNEPIARRANREDGCKGRFWEGRFKCQRLEDEGAVLACMAYVDLNPVRAGVAECPEASAFTSIFDRIVGSQGRECVAELEAGMKKPNERQEEEIKQARKRSQSDGWLCPIERVLERGGRKGEGLTLESYLLLVDWTGRAIREDKAGAIPGEFAGILERMELDKEKWVEGVKRYGSLYYRIAGKAEGLALAARKAGQQWLQGMRPRVAMYLRRAA